MLTALLVLAELLVLTNGQTLKTAGPYRVKGKTAVVTLSDGALLSVPLKDIDTAATDRANAPPTPIPPTPVPSPRSTARAITSLDVPARPTTEPGKAPQGEQFIRGEGTQATYLFELRKGMVVFSIAGPPTSEHFAMVLHHQDGTYIKLLANTSERSWTGSQAVAIKDSGKYMIQVTAKGEWSVGIAPR